MQTEATAANTIKTDVLLIAYPATGYVALVNNSGDRAFYFLEDCRKRGVSRLVSFGDHGYGSNGRYAIDARDVTAFIDRASAEGIVASFRPAVAA